MTRTALRALAADVPLELTRTTGRSMSALWLMVLGAPEIHANLERLGLEPRQRYFAARAAPLGAVPMPVVVATFFNFSPLAVSRAIPSAWEKATPAQILEAQLSGVDAGLRRAFATLDPAVIEEAATLMRTAATAAAERPEGRPLFAAYASLAWPDEPHLDLWHAHYLLREFRGDGHIAVLTSEGLTGIEAQALHIAMMPSLMAMFRTSRAWTDDQWAACIDGLASDGWLTVADDGAINLTDDGTERRMLIESRTDELDLIGWSRIGRTGCRRVMELAEPITEALHAADLGHIPTRSTI